MSTTDSVLIRPRDHVETRVSRYDRVNGWLVTMLIIVTFLVSVLFMLWLTTLRFSSRQTPPMMYSEEDPGEDKPLGEADDILEPGVEEFPEVEVPQLRDALEAVVSVSSVQAHLDVRDGSAEAMGRGRGLGSRDGGGKGGDGVIPEHKRWKVIYEANDINTYARQLSYFKIDLGAVSETNNQIIRIGDPGGARRVIRTDRKTENDKGSVYFGHQQPRMQRWDERMIRDTVGRDAESSLIVQFFNEETLSQLRAVEAEYLKQQGRTLLEVKNTFFKIKEVGGGYRFEVSNQTYRN